MYQEIINKIKPEMEKVINFLEKELANIRANRATPSLVEEIIVDCFGQKFPLKQLAAISVPEPKQILIQPWDKSYLEGIAQALQKRGSGFSSIIDKESIRINLPPLNEEYRKDLIRLVSEKEEQARKTLRKWREQAWKEVQEKTQQSKIREDDKFRAKDDLQELIDQYNEKIEKMGENKRKEIEN